MKDEEDDIEKYVNRNQDSQNTHSEQVKEGEVTQTGTDAQENLNENIQETPQVGQQGASDASIELDTAQEIVTNDTPEQQSQAVPDANIENTASAQSVSQEPTQEDDAVPSEVQRWNWGAFFLTWIWGIGNNVWLAFLSFIPGVGFIMAIILGIKGSEWAWKAKKYDSVEEFKRVQRKWSIWGLIIFILVFVVSFIFGFVSTRSQILNSYSRADDATVASNLRSMKTALTLYQNDNYGDCPADLSLLAPDYLKEIPILNNGTSYSLGVEEDGDCVVSAPVESIEDFASLDYDTSNGNILDMSTGSKIGY